MMIEAGKARGGDASGSTAGISTSCTEIPPGSDAYCIVHFGA